MTTAFSSLTERSRTEMPAIPEIASKPPGQALGQVEGILCYQSIAWERTINPLLSFSVGLLIQVATFGTRWC
jgi:hypothetical protein